MADWKSIFIAFIGLALLAGCTTTDTGDVVAAPEPTPYDRVNLSFEENGFIDGRSGWFFPQVLEGDWIADQAWEYQNAIVGIEYVKADDLLPIATIPVPTDDQAIEKGTISIVAYPIGYSKESSHPDIYLGSIPELAGLGYQKPSAMEEFWAFQKTIEQNKYNLWKLVKLQLGDSPDRIFHSQLVLQKLSQTTSEGIVITVGAAADCYVVIVIRKYIHNKNELDAFGEWAYDVLSELNLRALKY